MSLENRRLDKPVQLSQHVACHPLSPLSAREIQKAAGLVRNSLPEESELRFKAITLDEPAKAILVPYLAKEHDGQRLPSLSRRAFVSYYVRNTDRLHEAVVDLSNDQVLKRVQIGPEHHGSVSTQEILAVEENVFKNEKVKIELKKLQLPDKTKFICDPWIYGSDGKNDQKRMFMAFLYMRDPKNPENADSNHYAFPLPILPVLDASTMKVIRIDHLPTGKGPEEKPTQKASIHPPREYTPEHQSLRDDLKPLQVTQPKGASFKATKIGEFGEIIDWQKWSIKVGFNQREGMVLYDVRYDHRSLFYRLSLSDMNIPYADPRSPFHRKAAFDLGDVGAGIMANNLQLGCDCLGAIHYMDGIVSDDDGNADPRPNAICVHEQDNGLLWKHTNYRTARSALVRNRELVIQSIITVANYEYILAFIFNQAGEITYEVRASGIVSTQPIDEGISVPWGLVVHPGVLASHHQHLFSLRIDPAIDGHGNTLVSSEVRPMPRNDLNQHGVGYTIEDTTIKRSTGLDVDTSRNQVFKITNPVARNPVNGVPVSYRIQAPPFQKMVADSSSYHHKRAEFADHNIYLTRYHDDELYAGGKYTNQSRGGHGVRTWAARNEPTVAADGEGGEDIVVWVQFGLQHIVRQEDWPVMPAETIRVSLKPCNFFDGNPALDVAPSEQSINCSVQVGASEKHMQCQAKEVN